VTNDPAIAAVDAWEVLDSRGTPTVAASVRLAGGARGIARVPSGASTGRHEAHELRDGGPRYAGRGVLRAVDNARGELAAAVLGLDGTDQEAVDAALRTADGTPELSRLGANAVLAISVAAAMAAATAAGQSLWESLRGTPSLPRPMVNILSGGAHAGRCLDIQDVLAIPLTAGSFAEAIEWCAATRAAAVSLATERGLRAGLVADEGGLGLRLGSNAAALDFVTAAIELAGLRPGVQVGIGIDIAASQFYADGGYRLAIEDRSVDAAQWPDVVAGWVAAHPVVSVEDAAAEDDWPVWQQIHDQLDTGVQLIGDDLFATNVDRLRRGIAERSANAILVKPNQAGTLSDALAALQSAQAAGFGTIVSARSGETEDSWIADLAVGWGAGQLKVGSTTRSERTAKWNRVLEIEHTTALPYPAG
jgi:enolase